MYPSRTCNMHNPYILLVLYLDRLWREEGCRHPRVFLNFLDREVEQNGRRSSFLYPHLFVKAGCVVNWSGVKCLAHNFEYSVTLNPLRRKLRIQILLIFGSFGNRYIDTPFLLQILHLKATHWVILIDKLKNFRY